MYEGLKPELTDIVYGIRKGERVSVEHSSYNEVEGIVGYVHGKNSSRLKIRPEKAPESILAKLLNWLRQEYISYGSIVSIRRLDEDSKHPN